MQKKRVRAHFTSHRSGTYRMRRETRSFWGWKNILWLFIHHKFTSSSVVVGFGSVIPWQWVKRCLSRKKLNGKAKACTQAIFQLKFCFIFVPLLTPSRAQNNMNEHDRAMLRMKRCYRWNYVFLHRNEFYIWVVECRITSFNLFKLNWYLLWLFLAYANNLQSWKMFRNKY